MKSKVVIVGAGQVGAAFAYALAQQGLCNEIVLIDINTDLAHGQAMDLAHGQAYFPTVEIRTGSVKDYADATIIVITAGADQRPGETRLDLLDRNAKIIKFISADIVAQDPQGIVIMVTNPVDVLTEVAIRALGLPRNRVFGSGTVLDSARLRYLVSKRCDVDIHSTHVFIIGEHGESEFAAWSMASIGGVPLDAFCQGRDCCFNTQEVKKQLEEEVRYSAYHIIDDKGSTAFGVGMALIRIVEAVLRDSKSVLTVSASLDGAYGIHGMSLSVPCVVSAQGIERIIEAPLSPEETAALHNSATILNDALANL